MSVEKALFTGLSEIPVILLEVYGEGNVLAQVNGADKKNN